MTEKRIVFVANLTAVSTKGAGLRPAFFLQKPRVDRVQAERGEQVRGNNFKKNFIPAPP